jgi:hypothetical protein
MNFDAHDGLHFHADRSIEMYVCASTHHCLSVTRSFNQLRNHRLHFFSTNKTCFYFTQVCFIKLLAEKSDSLLRDAICFVFTILWSSHHVLSGVSFFVINILYDLWEIPSNFVIFLPLDICIRSNLCLSDSVVSDVETSIVVILKIAAMWERHNIHICVCLHVCVCTSWHLSICVGVCVCFTFAHLDISVYIDCFSCILKCNSIYV